MARTTRRRRSRPQYPTICITTSTGGFDPAVTTTFANPVWRVGMQEEVGVSVNFASLSGAGEKRVRLGPRGALADITGIDVHADDMSMLFKHLRQTPAVVLLYGYTNGSLRGDLSSISGLSALQNLRLGDTAVSGVLSSLGGLVALQYLYLHSTSISGDLSSISALTALKELHLAITLISGNLSSISGLTALRYLYLQSASVSGGGIGTLLAMRVCYVLSLSWSQVIVDAFIDSVYDARASYTYATPALNIGGTNAAPSGVYQDATPPTTGKEKIFKLVNDPDVEGFNTWTITYTA